MRTRVLYALAFGIALLGAPAALSAQSTIILQGRVTSTGGEPVLDARITVTNTETAESRSARTSANGTYVIVGLNPGPYNVQATRVGLAPGQRSVRLLVGQRASLDFSLVPAAVTLSTVTVQSSNTSTFEVQRSDVSTAVVQTEIQNLPLNTRNTLNLAAIVPGIKTFAPTAGRSLPAAGALPDLRFYNFYLDGVEWKSMFNGNLVGIPQTGSPVPQEALREFRLHLNPYDAEFTRGGAYIISAVTQRGTNERQGSAFLYYQDNSLRALDEFQRRSRAASSTFHRVDYNRKQLGFNLRGPIVKDKLFYAASYELNNTADAISVIPLKPAYNPTLWNQYAGDFPAPTKNHNAVLRLTANANERHTLDAIYAGRYYNSETNFGGRSTQSSGINAKYWVHSAQLRDTYTPTASTVNQFSVHMLYWNHNESPLIPGPTKNYPSAIFGTAGFPLILKEMHLRATDKFTWTMPGGKHILEAGADLEHVATSSFLPSNKDGVFDYLADTSSLPRQGTIAVGFFSPNSTNDALAEANGWVTGAYLQDRWQATPQLSINLGLRYDLELNTLLNDFQTPWATVPELQQKLPAKFLTGDRKNDVNNIAPRFSFSWDVFDTHRTFIRGGWGLMYGRVPSTYAFGEKQASTWRSYTIQNPGTSDPAVLRAKVIADGTTARPNITLVSRQIETPKTNMMSFGIGHQLSGDLAVNLDYVGQLSSQLYVNTAANPVFSGVRKLTPNYGNITLWDSFGEASFQALTGGLTFDRTTDERLPIRLNVAYTLGFYKASFESFGAWTDASFFKMQPSSGDERHRVVLSGMHPLPFGFELSGVGIVASPSRFIALAGTDVNKNGLFNDDFVGSERAIRPSGGFDVWYKTLDMRLAKVLPLTGGDASISFEVFNVFNTVNWSGYTGAQTDAAGNPLNYGKPTGAYAPRQAQAGIRYKF